MRFITPFRRRGYRRAVLAVGGILVTTRSVAAHGMGAAEGSGVSIPVTVGVVTLLGISAGSLAVVGREQNRTRDRSWHVGEAIGLLLVGLGGLAAGAAVLEQSMLGLAGVLVGFAVGAAVARRGGCRSGTTVTVGAISVHRLIEGVTLATLTATGTSLSLVGTVVVSGHTVAECVAIGGQRGRSQLRSIGSVIFVSLALVLGAIVGSAGLVATEALPNVLVAGVVGGVLVPLGIAEIRPPSLDLY